MAKLKLLSVVMGLAVTLGLTMYIKAGDFGIINHLILMIRVNKSLTLLVGSFSIGFTTYIMQRFTKNSIVDSSFFGIASFNGLALVIVYSIFYGSGEINNIYKYWLPFISLIASVSIALLLSVTVMKQSKTKSKSVVLAGIIMNYAFTAIAYFYSKFLSVGAKADMGAMSFGAINEGYGPAILGSLFGVQVLTVVWYQLIYKKINVNNINIKLSASLGNNTRSVNIQQIIIVGANIAIGFSLLGGVAFVGVISANFAKRVVKKSRWSAMVAGLCGMFITALAYLIMNGFSPLYYTIGVTTSLISLPYFIFKVIRSR